SDVKLSELLDRYQDLCGLFGALPPPQVVNVDHGGKRFLLFAIPAGAAAGQPAGCVTPAIAHINVPEAGARLPANFRVSGWAMKDGAGVGEVRVTLDGKPVALARYGMREEWPQQFYRGRSRDPAQPMVGFIADVDATAIAPGRHWLG